MLQWGGPNSPTGEISDMWVTHGMGGSTKGNRQFREWQFQMAIRGGSVCKNTGKSGKSWGMLGERTFSAGVHVSAKALLWVRACWVRGGQCGWRGANHVEIAWELGRRNNGFWQALFSQRGDIWLRRGCGWWLGGCQAGDKWSWQRLPRREHGWSA